MHVLYLSTAFLSSHLVLAIGSINKLKSVQRSFTKRLPGMSDLFISLNFGTRTNYTAKTTINIISNSTAVSGHCVKIDMQMQHRSRKGAQF